MKTANATLFDASAELPQTPKRRFRPYREYRASGFAWLDDVPTHWSVRRLKTGLSRNDGGVWGEDDDPDGTIVLRSTEQTVNGGWSIESPAKRQLSPTERQAALLRCGDLVVTKSSGSQLHIGKTSIVTAEVEAMECCFSNFMQRLRANSATEPRFVYWLLNSPVGREQLAYGSNSTVGLANLSSSIIGGIWMSFPPLPEQRAIAAFLDRETAKIDSLVAKKRRLIELLREKRTALISHAVTKGLNPAAPMKPSGIDWLGDVPEHWEAKRLRFLGEAILGLTYEPTDVTAPGDGTLVLRSSNISAGRIVLDDNVYVTTPIPRELRTRAGDILICSRNGSRALIGKCARLDESVAGVTFGAFMTIFRSEASAYLFYVLNSPIFDYQSGAFLTSTINQLTLSNLKNMEAPIPPPQEQAEIVAFLDQKTAALDRLRDRIQAAIDQVVEYRSALISAAVTGKLDVRQYLRTTGVKERQIAVNVPHQADDDLCTTEVQPCDT